MNQILSRTSNNITSTGNVAELLFDGSSKLLDYSYNYPYFQNSKADNQYILYAVLPHGSFDLDEVKKNVFMTADEAEDFLLDQVVDKPAQHLFKAVRPANLLAGGLYLLILNFLLFDIVSTLFIPLMRS